MYIDIYSISPMVGEHVASQLRPLVPRDVVFRINPCVQVYNLQPALCIVIHVNKKIQVQYPKFTYYYVVSTETSIMSKTLVQQVLWMLKELRWKWKAQL